MLLSKSQPGLKLACLVALSSQVVNMANISPYHWLVVCCMSYGLSLFAQEVLTTIEEVQSQTESVALWAPDVPDLYNPNVEDPEDRGGDVVEGGGRRQLGGSGSVHKRPVFACDSRTCSERLLAITAAPFRCEASIPCGVPESHFRELIPRFFDDAGANDTHGLGIYNVSCMECVGSLPVVDLPTTALAIFGFAFFGWSLLWCQSLLLWLVGHRTGKIAHYHGAKNARYLPTLVKHLERHLQVHTGRTAIDVGADGENEDIEDSEGHIMMVFHHAGKTANSLMSIRMFTFWMNVTKMNMLLACFYFGFYVCHIQFRVDMAYADRPMTAFWIHAAMLVPCALLVFVIFPKTSRKLALLLGILHLQHEAVTGVGARMELVLQLRGRIRDKLTGARLVAGEPQVDKGHSLLQVVSTGDTEILKTLDTLDEEETQRIRTHMEAHPENRAKWSHHHEDETHDPKRIASAIRIQHIYLRYKIWKKKSSIFQGRLINRITREKAESLLTERQVRKIQAFSEPNDSFSVCER